MNTLQTVLALWPLVAFVIAALWIAVTEARPVRRCSCGKPAETKWCADCTEQLALSATIHAMSQR